MRTWARMRSSRRWKTGRSSRVAFEVAEGAFGFDQLLVAERDVLGREGGVAGGEEVLAVEAFLGVRPWRGRSRGDPRGLAEVAGEGRVVTERALAAEVCLFFRSVLVAVWRSRASANRASSVVDPVELLPAAGAVVVGFGGVVADDVADGGVAVADLDVFDAQVVAHDRA